MHSVATFFVPWEDSGLLSQKLQAGMADIGAYGIKQNNIPASVTAFAPKRRHLSPHFLLFSSPLFSFAAMIVKVSNL